MMRFGFRIGWLKAANFATPMERSALFHHRDDDAHVNAHNMMRFGFRIGWHKQPIYVTYVRKQYDANWVPHGMAHGGHVCDNYGAKRTY
jgi:hypothetical protein